MEHAVDGQEIIESGRSNFVEFAAAIASKPASSRRHGQSTTRAQPALKTGGGRSSCRAADSYGLGDHRRWRVGGLDHELAGWLIPHQKIDRGLPVLLRFSTADQEQACLQAASRRYEQVGLRRLCRDWLYEHQVRFSIRMLRRERAGSPTTTELIGSGIRIAVT